MNGIICKDSLNRGIDDLRLEKALIQSFSLVEKNFNRVLLIPPDYSRKYSAGGKITQMYYKILKDRCIVDIMPGVGSHEPVSRTERIEMFSENIPESNFLQHNWRKDVVKIGEVPKDYVSKISENLFNESIDVEVNKRLVDGTYDLIISIGQVVPHEIVGMSNYSKNIFVGCGGWSMISKTHALGAFYGMERIMGKDKTPVRMIFDYAENNFLNNIPLLYVLTVTSKCNSDSLIHGIFIGRDRTIFEQAVELSQEKNIIYVEKPIKKIVTFLEDREFKSTWIGNKAIYRTRMAIADGGELVILAPGIEKFGEDNENDRLIRKFGYRGRDKIFEWYRRNEEISKNLSVTAHLIHGSSEGRFEITYAVRHLTCDEVINAGYRYLPYKAAAARYNTHSLQEGFNMLSNGEEIYYIGNPAMGLWIDRSRYTL